MTRTFIATITVLTGLIVGSFMFTGETNAGVPEPITVDGQTTEFTWTDDNSGENLTLYTDKEVYTNGLSHAEVYVALVNDSGKTQDVSLLAYFRDTTKRINKANVLKVVEEEYEIRDVYEVCEDREVKHEATATSSATTTTETVCWQEEEVTGTTTATTTAWVPIGTIDRTLIEIEKENELLETFSTARKSVDGFTAEEKTELVSLEDGQVAYFKLHVEFPAQTEDNFFFEAIGDNAYGHLDPWYDSNWNNRVKIEVNPDHVDSTLTNYPVYVDLSDLPAGAVGKMNNDCGDIRVTESDETTETPREVVTCDTTGETGELHFLGDSISSSATTTFYLYYDNDGASDYADGDTFGRDAVWADYTLVAHGDEASGDLIDSTGGSAWTDQNTVTSGTGQIEGGREFDDANNEYFSSTATYLGTVSETTVQAWSKSNDSTASDGQNHVIISISENGTNGNFDNWMQRNPDGNNELRFGLRNGSGSRTFIDTTTTVTDNTWVMFHGTWDGTTMRMYVDGSEDATTGSLSGSMDDTNSTNKAIGGVANGTNNNANFNGLLDEVRVRQTQLSADWVDAEYTNQNTPGTFYFVGAEETEGGGEADPVDRQSEFFF